MARFPTFWRGPSLSIVASYPQKRSLALPFHELAASLASWPGACLLESGPGFGRWGRWSLFAAEPRLKFEMFDDAWTIHRQDRSECGKTAGLERLARLLDEFDLAGQDFDPGDSSPFQGGMIGYVGYDLAPLLERLPRRSSADSRLPDVSFGLFDTFVLIDHLENKAKLQGFDLLGEGAAAVEARLDRWEDRLRQKITPPIDPKLRPLRAEVSREAYGRSVSRALEYIAAGDVFQVNLSQRFSTEAETLIDPRWIYERLKVRSPAPFSALIRLGDSAIVSASPELFYSTEGSHIQTRPIKGTRPRGVSVAEDLRLSDELRASPKDRAELTMIVDLERNDLGRVCRYGSVLVSENFAVESFAQVHHLVATVEGKLRPEVGPIDVLRALFPGGSITGAPKIRAMEIIDELEPNRRSAYTGAIGYFSRGGRSQFNIAIRTILVEANRLSFQVGGGIVADSDPDAEYLETLDKAEGMRLAIEGGDA